MSTITIRDLSTSAEFRAAQALQLAVWGGDATGVAPDHILLTAQKNGGVVMGAFQPEAGGGEKLLGFVFGFIGRTTDGTFKHCSHMLGVLPDVRDVNLGYRLKLAQRQRVLQQGLDLITWTFDPLESRNGHLNFHKLGAVCNTYYRSLYGDMIDGLNAGIPSDRLQVDWLIREPHVTERIRGGWRPNSLAELRAAHVPLLNPAAGSATLPHPADTPTGGSAPRCLVAIPVDFQTVKLADIGLARAWRMQTRAILEQLFMNGYLLTDLLPEPGHGVSYYLAEKAGMKE